MNLVFTFYQTTKLILYSLINLYDLFSLKNLAIQMFKFARTKMLKFVLQFIKISVIFYFKKKIIITEYNQLNITIEIYYPRIIHLCIFSLG